LPISGFLYYQMPLFHEPVECQQMVGVVIMTAWQSHRRSARIQELSHTGLEPQVRDGRGSGVTWRGLRVIGAVAAHDEQRPHPERGSSGTGPGAHGARGPGSRPAARTRP